MTMGFSIVGILILTAIYLILRLKKLSVRSFWFGVGLHFITLLLIWTNVEFEGRLASFLIASLVSLTISGVVYKKLNSTIGIEDEIRKCADVQ
jgi:membrane protein implicated in regulation of membrane protease activity